MLRAVVHHLSRVGLAAYLGTLIRAILLTVVPVWLWGVELWGL